MNDGLIPCGIADIGGNMGLECKGFWGDLGVVEVRVFLGHNK